jgi:murein L,D-transpeptidase YafK
VPPNLSVQRTSPLSADTAGRTGYQMRKLVAALGIGVVAVGVLLGWANAQPPSLPPGTRADRVVVLKSAHRLELLRNGHVIATYPVSLGRGGSGPKQREGDGRTPEGEYTIDYHKHDSAFFRALHVSYPNASDRARARAAGAATGGSIMVHGLPPKAAVVGRLQLAIDWTNGCIALSNADMKQVFNAVGDGTPIVIQH